MTKKIKPGQSQAREAMSTNKLLDIVRGAFSAQFNPSGRGGMAVQEPYCYVEETFLADGYLICSMEGQYYRVDFSKKDGAYQFTPKADWKKVEQTYTAAESRRTGYFATLADLSESELDAEAFIAKGVTLIRPGFSTNTDKAGRPRYYAPEMLRAAAPVFEGTRAFRNHPRKSDEKDLPERDVRDLTGYYTHVRAADDGRLLGDFHVVGEARTWLWPLIVETKTKPDLVELSINALGQTSLGEAEGRKAVMVETIVKANSVDVVTTGAAGGSFAGALLQSDGDRWTADLLGAMAFDEWRESRPEFVERLKAEWKTIRETEALRGAQGKLDDLTKQLADLTEAKRAMEADLGTFRRAEIADRLLAASGLPIKLRAAMRDGLLAEADEAGMRRAIERERALYAAAPKPPVPVHGAGPRPTGAPAETRPRAHPAAGLLGLSESAMPQPGENAEAYRARRLAEQAKT